MTGEDDFTFCQVGLQDGQEVLESKDLPFDINGIAINDNVSHASCSSHDDGILPNNSSPIKQERVGSLSFNVIDMSSSKQSNKSSRQVVSRDPGKSVENPEEQRTVARKPTATARAKVPFEKGYSQMQWLKLTQTHPDLAGLKGQSNRRLISLSEVKQHQTEDSMWTVLKGRVYNISPYMKFHPGGINIILNTVRYKQLVGVDMLMKAVGKDSTSLFNKYHAWVNFEFLLEKCLVGILDDGR